MDRSTVTALKWRPKSFQTMVGQQHVLQPLINALKQQRLHHAYLFTGTRGVGKTTLARIIAKCLNCERGVGPEPCGVCDACQGIDAGCFVDVIEVDAASRTKVEDTRELLDNVQYLPTQGRFKIYIIDEVHMLSTSSFNALLKTLEEPPAHVKFLLATTDPQKLPVTVLSRCLQFHLKHLDASQIAQQLTHILQTENLAFEPEALNLLAEAGQGSMRDALSLLDQAIAHGAGSVRTDSVRAMLGTLDPNTVTAILTALQTQNGPALLEAVEAIASDSGNFAQALDAVIQALHDLALIQVVPQATHLKQARYERLKPFAQAFSPELVQLLYEIAIRGRKDLAWAPSSRAGFEMTCLRMLAFYPENEQGIPEVELPRGVSVPYSSPSPKANPDIPTTPLEDEFVPLVSHPKMEPVIVAPRQVETRPEVPAKIPAPFEGESREKIPAPFEGGSAVPSAGGVSLPPWDELLPKLKLAGMAGALASHCVVHSFNGHQLILNLSDKHAPLNTKAVVDRVTQAVADFLKKPVVVEVKLVDAVEDTPAQRRQVADEQAFAQAKTELESDPVVQQLVQTFDAQIIDVSTITKARN